MNECNLFAIEQLGSAIENNLSTLETLAHNNTKKNINHSISSSFGAKFVSKWRCISFQINIVRAVFFSFFASDIEVNKFSCNFSAMSRYYPDSENTKRHRFIGQCTSRTKWTKRKKLYSTDKVERENSSRYTEAIQWKRKHYWIEYLFYLIWNLLVKHYLWHIGICLIVINAFLYVCVVAFRFVCLSRAVCNIV